jgi:hypothetical protein
MISFGQDRGFGTQVVARIGALALTARRRHTPLTAPLECRRWRQSLARGRPPQLLTETGKISYQYHKPDPKVTGGKGRHLCGSTLYLHERWNDDRFELQRPAFLLDSPFLPSVRAGV